MFHGGVKAVVAFAYFTHVNLPVSVLYLHNMHLALEQVYIQFNNQLGNGLSICAQTIISLEKDCRSFVSILRVDRFFS